MHEHGLLSCLLVVGVNVAGIPVIAKTNARTDAHYGAIELDVIAMSVTRIDVAALASPVRSCLGMSRKLFFQVAP